MSKLRDRYIPSSEWTDLPDSFGELLKQFRKAIPAEDNPKYSIQKHYFFDALELPVSRSSSSNTSKEKIRSHKANYINCLEGRPPSHAVSVKNIFDFARYFKQQELFDVPIKTQDKLNVPQHYFRLALKQLASQRLHQVLPADYVTREQILYRALKERFISASERDKLSELCTEEAAQNEHDKTLSKYPTPEIKQGTTDLLGTATSEPTVHRNAAE